MGWQVVAGFQKRKYQGGLDEMKSTAWRLKFRLFPEAHVASLEKTPAIHITSDEEEVMKW